jgi:phosphate transport system protein
MTRLLDLGIQHIQQIVMDMSRISGDSVLRTIESYEKNANVKKEIFEWSEMLLVMQDEVADLAVELIACYQPVATDLRFIRSGMEIA